MYTFTSEYILVEWQTDQDNEEQEVSGKVADLVDIAGGFVPGANVRCNLREGTFSATVLAAGVWVVDMGKCVGENAEIYACHLIGSRTECFAAQAQLEKDTGALQIKVAIQVPNCSEVPELHFLVLCILQIFLTPSQIRPLRKVCALTYCVYEYATCTLL